MMTLKLCLSSITSPLVYILNLSLSQGVFPDELKIANVIPLYKADDRMCFNNYRPGGRLNKKDGLTRYGDSHVKDKTS